VFLRRRAPKISVYVFKSQINQVCRRLGFGRCCVDDLGHLFHLVGHDVHWLLRSMVLNYLCLLVNSRFLVMNDRLWLVLRHSLLVNTRARMRETGSRALSGRRRLRGRARASSSG
jgi:hypothetical protein